MAKLPKGHRCMIGDIVKVRKGETLCFNADTIGCAGGRRFCGFQSEITPAFEYFLSYGIPGKLEGERYKKSPEMVKDLSIIKHHRRRRKIILSSKDGTHGRSRDAFGGHFLCPS